MTSQLDQQMLDSLRDLLGEKFYDLINAYLKDCHAKLARMLAAFNDNDFDIIRDEAHGIKGSSRNVGANALADICEKVEAQARDHDATDIQQHISAIETMFAAVETELSTLLPPKVP